MCNKNDKLISMKGKTNIKIDKQRSKYTEGCGSKQVFKKKKKTTKYTKEKKKSRTNITIHLDVNS